MKHFLCKNTVLDFALSLTQLKKRTVGLFKFPRVVPRDEELPTGAVCRRQRGDENVKSSEEQHRNMRAAFSFEGD